MHISVKAKQERAAANLKKYIVEFLAVNELVVQE
jgi:hypothetical protein